MTLSSPITMSDADKLEALCRLDQFRHWRSLDEKRYCLVCGKIIVGHEIQVAGGTPGDRRLRLNCPSEHCNSIPMDWVMPTDEILANVEIRAAEERKAAASMQAHLRDAQPDRPSPQRLKTEQNGIASRLRKFAFHFMDVS
jgi:hypothetical protein